MKNIEKTQWKSMVFASWGHLGGPLGALSGRLAGLLGRLEAILGVLERSVGDLEPSETGLGVVLGLSWVPRSPFRYL